jgi:hypothetical protein
MLPRNLNAIFRTQWLPIFRCLQEVLTPQSTETFENDEDEIEKKYKRSLAHLKERVSYCWNKTDPTKFTLATWSNKTSRSAIMKCGNSGDREKLSEASNRNCVRPNQRRKKKIVDKPLYPTRQRRRIEQQRRVVNEIDEDPHDGEEETRANEMDEDDGFNDFAEAFLNVPLNPQLTDAQAQRDKETLEEVVRAMEDGERAAAAHRQVAGDAVATDGSRLFVQRPPAGLPLNHGDNSYIGRQRYAKVLDSAEKQPARKKPPRTTTARKKKPPRTTTAQKKPPPTTIESPPTCAIQGCAFGTGLIADHKCHNKCGRVFHNLCAQANDLCDDYNELDMYCSMECKRSNK